MTNKNKHKQSNKKQAAAPAPPAVGKADEKSAANSPSTTRNQEPFSFSPPQLTSLIFLSMGFSRLLEWKRAAYEITQQTEKHQNGTGLCQEYMSTTSEADYDEVCSMPITATLVALQYDAALNLLAMVVFLALQCWKDEALFNRLNAYLSLTPVSMTLLMLQACRPWITKGKSMKLTITCAICIAVASPATSAWIREIIKGQSSNGVGRINSNNNRGSLQSIVLSSMVFLSLYEMYQWWQTSQISSATSILTLEAWNDGLNVFLYSLVLDKLTVSALLTFVWFYFEESRQRTFLIFWAAIKAWEYNFQLPEYQEDLFTDFATMNNILLTCCVASAVAWIAPPLSFSKPKTA
jgi:hypothetical protein